MQNNRPTSPHLQIYKWNICSFTSIMHRFTGIALYLSVVVISWYIVFFTYNYDLVSAGDNCDCPLWKTFEYLTVAAIVVVIFSISYHLSNGVRHLFWDIGKGFEIERAKFTGYLTLVMTFLISGTVLGFIWYYKFM